MTFEDLKTKLDELVNQHVTFTRIAGNSIIVYFFGEPGDKTVHSVWLNPTWRYERDRRIVMGSQDLPWHEDFKSSEEYEREFHRVCNLCDPLYGSTLLKATVDFASSDLTLEFSGEQILRKFANSASDDQAWTYRNIPLDVAADVSPSGIKVGTASAGESSQCQSDAKGRT
ncbi:MAG TPA: hypothetical protein VGW33_01150 [Terriglobia bacterium]|nr:hypothetical protein [Terriglobia bacterium]